MEQAGDLSRLWQDLTFALPLAPPSLLPPSLGENNDGAGAAFKGGLDSADGHGLGRVSGQLRVPPQLLE